MHGNTKIKFVVLYIFGQETPAYRHLSRDPLYLYYTL